MDYPDYMTFPIKRRHIDEGDHSFTNTNPVALACDAGIGNVSCIFEDVECDDETISFVNSGWSEEEDQYLRHEFWFSITQDLLNWIIFSSEEPQQADEIVVQLAVNQEEHQRIGPKLLKAETVILRGIADIYTGDNPILTG